MYKKPQRCTWAIVNELIECETCEKFSKKIRKCLKCETKFVPNCTHGFVCRSCYDHNRSRWDGEKFTVSRRAGGRSGGSD